MSRSERVHFTYLIALAATVTAVLIRWLLDPLLGDNLPFLTLYGAVAVSAWYGGVGPAVLTIALGYLMADYLFIGPRGSFGVSAPAVWTGLLLYLMASLIITGLGVGVMAAQRRYRMAALDALGKQHQLESEIASRRQAEAVLRQSEERFRRYFELGLIGMTITSPNKSIVEVNDKICEILGYQRSELLRINWADVTHPDDIAADIATFNRVLAGQIDGYSMDKRFIRKNGEMIYATISVKCVRRADGSVDHFVALLQDISERKSAEDRIKALNDRLSTDLARMTRLHQLSTRLVQTADVAALLREILDVAIEITGADMGNIQLLEGDVLKIVAQRGFDAPFLDFFASVHRSEGACGTVMQSGARVIVEDVAASPIFAGTPALEVMQAAGVQAIQSIPLCSRSGRLIGVLSTHWRQRQRTPQGDLRLLDVLARQATDFIERVQAEEALRKADSRKDEFLATLAHELRSPLASIRNALNIMRAADKDAALVEHARSIMERQVGQMVRLIDDLLDVSRISRGKFELRKEHAELIPILDNAVDTALPLIEASGHELIFDKPAEPIHVDADQMRLVQVFSNLLNNAAKHMDPGGRIWLTAARREHEVFVTVRDTGVGIPAESLPHIFDMFTQVHPPVDRSHGGLGIGLTLVKRLVEMHGGSVDARSEGVGKGAEFTVRLSSASGPAVRHPPSDEGPPATAVMRRVLIADDDADTADSMAAVLRLTGHEVRTVQNGEQAVEEGAVFRPDVMLLDIAMPRLDGYAAARKIREQPWGKRIVLVALTGWGQEEDKRRATEAGFDQHFTKPVSPLDVERLVKELHSRPCGVADK